MECDVQLVCTLKLNNVNRKVEYITPFAGNLKTEVPSFHRMNQFRRKGSYQMLRKDFPLVMGYASRVRRFVRGIDLCSHFMGYSLRSSAGLRFRPTEQ